MRRIRMTAAAAALALVPLLGLAEEVTPRHGIAMHGDPKYGPTSRISTTSIPMRRRAARCDCRRSAPSTASTPSSCAACRRRARPSSSTRLMTGSADEAFTEYGLLAETSRCRRTAPGSPSTLRPEARWHDGKPITAEDVILTLRDLKAKGAPFYRVYYAERGEGGEGRRAQGQVHLQARRQPRAAADPRPAAGAAEALVGGRATSTRPTLEPPLGSGPYKHRALRAGPLHHLSARRRLLGQGPAGQAWAQQFRHASATTTTATPPSRSRPSRPAQIDFRAENIAKDWATAYDIPGGARRPVVKRTRSATSCRPACRASSFNMRRAAVPGPRGCAEALAYAFDFEWIEQEPVLRPVHAHRQLLRQLRAGRRRGLPQGRGAGDPRAATAARSPTRSSPSRVPAAGDRRLGQQPRQPAPARSSCCKAGGLGRCKDGRLVNAQRRSRFEFEILLNGPSFERIALPYRAEPGAARHRRRACAPSTRRSTRARIDALRLRHDRRRLRPVAVARQRAARLLELGSAPTRTGSRNVVGISDPVVDELVELVIAAPDRESLVARTRALDRVLLWGHYVVPHWHIRAYPRRLLGQVRPARRARRSTASPFDAWWIDAAKAGRARAAAGAN